MTNTMRNANLPMPATRSVNTAHIDCLVNGRVPYEDAVVREAVYLVTLWGTGDGNYMAATFKRATRTIELYMGAY